MYKKLFHNKKSLNRLASQTEIWLIGTILILILLRLIVLPFSPPLFAMDEAASGAHIASMVLHGTNAHSQAWPLFSSSLGGGYTTPVYLYPAVLWAFIFGFSEIALRYFSEFSTILAVLLMAYGVKFWFDRTTALLYACAGLALPWGWLQGSLAWDPALVPLFTSVAFVAFSSILFTKSLITKRVMLILLPVSIVALAYLYPPLRIGAPLLLLACYSVLYAKKLIRLPEMILTVIGVLLLSLPLLVFLNSPQALERSQNVLVFNNSSVINIPVDVVLNILNLVSPWFLFFTGDHNLRHSTGFQGMLGWASLPATIACIWLAIRARKAKKIDNQMYVYVALFGIFAGLLGSALTYEGQPHSLRATAAWPFMVMLLALGWRWIINQNNQLILATSISFFVITTTLYVVDYAYSFPARSRDAFDNSLYENSRYRGIPSYPGIAQNYYDIRR